MPEFLPQQDTASEAAGQNVIGHHHHSVAGEGDADLGVEPSQPGFDHAAQKVVRADPGRAGVADEIVGGDGERRRVEMSVKSRALNDEVRRVKTELGTVVAVQLEAEVVGRVPALFGRHRRCRPPAP